MVWKDLPDQQEEHVRRRCLALFSFDEACVPAHLSPEARFDDCGGGLPACPSVSFECVLRVPIGEDRPSATTCDGKRESRIED